MSRYHYVPEGICCYISPTPFTAGWAIHRLRKDDQHRYVIDPVDLANYMGQGYVEENVPGYVWTLPPPDMPLTKPKM